jgi:metallo-beta-lactamase class B
LRHTLLAIAALLFMGSAAHAGLDPPEWTQPQTPFQIVGPIYYVGSKGLSAYLIRTSDGLVLLDGTMEENVPMIERNIAALGFRVRDVKLLINTHAHFDHAAGLAQLKADSGARMAASAGDRRALESGTPPSVTSYGVVKFPPVKVDTVVADGVPVMLGDVSLTPILTPGHTPGCTSWSTTVRAGGRSYAVIFPCSFTVAGNRLVGNTGYPGIVADYRATFARLATLHADIVLTPHPEQADVLGRRARQAAGDANAFVAPDLLPTLASSSQAAFVADLAKQTAHGGN